MILSLSELEKKFLNEILKNLSCVKSTNQVFTISSLVIDNYFTSGNLIPENEASKIESNISKFLQKNKFVKTPTDEVEYSFTDKGMELLALGSIELYEMYHIPKKVPEKIPGKLAASLSYMLSMVNILP